MIQDWQKDEYELGRLQRKSAAPEVAAGELDPEETTRSLLTVASFSLSVASGAAGQDPVFKRIEG
jgi:hypothetical protein